MTLTDTPPVGLSDTRRVIATFHRSRTWQVLVMAIAAIAGMIFLTAYIVYHFANNTLPREKLSYILATLPVAWMALLFFMRGSIRMLRQMVFDGGRRLWIENGQLIQCADSVDAMPCKNIASVSLGKMEKYDVPEIRITARDGVVTRLNANGFAESPEAIVARLKAALAPNLEFSQ